MLQRRRLNLGFVFLGLVCAGCNLDWRAIPNSVDGTCFRYTGTTLFSKRELKTMKEVHFDNGLLSGHDLVLEGSVVEVSRRGTWLVLKDQSARVLVVLTDVEYMQSVLATHPPKTLRVLGAVQSGLKGLPYFQARSVKVVDGMVAVAPESRT